MGDLPNEGVDLGGLDVVELLHRVLDLALVCADVSNEDKGVVLLDLLHRTFRIQRMEDDFLGIEARCMWDTLAWVFWRAGER